MNRASTLGIIPCSKEKAWDLDAGQGSMRADKIYRSSFHLLARRFAEKNSGRWVILSAKYGFLDPWDEVEGPYDMVFGGPDQGCITDASLREQVLKKKLHSYEKVLLICTKCYADRAASAFQNLPLHLEYTLKGRGGWGSMHTWLRSEL